MASLGRGAGKVKGSGPRLGCFTCNGDHVQRGCPKNMDKSGKPWSKRKMASLGARMANPGATMARSARAALMKINEVLRSRS